MVSIVVPELIILLVIVILVLGPERIGKEIHSLREASRRKNQIAIRREPAKDKQNKNI